MGFGGNFYGFFLVAAVWVLAYYVWARWQNNREETRYRDQLKGKSQPPPAPDSQKNE